MEQTLARNQQQKPGMKEMATFLRIWAEVTQQLTSFWRPTSESAPGMPVIALTLLTSEMPGLVQNALTVCCH